MQNEVSVDRLVATYIKIRETRAGATAAYEKQDKLYKEQLEMVENALLARAHEEGVTGFKTEHGTTYQETRVQASIADAGVLYPWIKENDALDMFERRIKSTAVKQYMDDHEGAIPPGVNVFTQLTMKVRRA